MLRSSLILTLVLLAAGGVAAYNDKFDAKLLVGKWEPAGDKIPPGVKVVMEFTKDNKLIIEIDVQGKNQKMEGKYKVDGETLELTIVKDGKEDTKKATIIKLTEKEVVVKDDMGEEQALKKAS